MPFCPECGTEVNREDEFCFSCGEKLQQIDIRKETSETHNNAEYTCSKCKKPIRFEDRYCSNCGSELVKEEIEVEGNAEEFQQEIPTEERTVKEELKENQIMAGLTNQTEGKQGVKFNLVILFTAVALILGIVIGWLIHLPTVSDLEFEVFNLKHEYSNILDKYDDLNADFKEITAKYPPKYFYSTRELENWLIYNSVSERPYAEYAEQMYIDALDIQQNALEDGYIISVNVESDETGENYLVYCTAVVGDRLYWWQPDSDQVELYTFTAPIR